MLGRMHVLLYVSKSLRILVFTGCVYLRATDKMNNEGNVPNVQKKTVGASRQTVGGEHGELCFLLHGDGQEENHADLFYMFPEKSGPVSVS